MQSEGFRTGQASVPLARPRPPMQSGPGALFGTNTDQKKPEFLGSGLLRNDAREAVLVLCLIGMRQNKTRLLWVYLSRRDQFQAIKKFETASAIISLNRT